MEAVTHVKQASVKTFVSGRQETLSSILLPCLTHCLYKLLIKSHFFCVFLCLFCRVYINYFDINAANVGWNGSTFA